MVSSTRAIPLTSGKVALVDTADYELVSTFKWRAVRVTGGLWYAETRLHGNREFMHRLLLGCGPGEQVDHRDGDGLNNRRYNLRPTTHALNQANRRHVRSTSGYKGVTQRAGRWRAYLTVEGRFRSLGSFPTAEAAARAYDQAARELFGEHACTNQDLGLLRPAGPPS